MVGPIEPIEQHGRSHQMVTFECPWCTEPTDLDGSALVEFACGACGIAVEIAPDPIHDRIDQAA